MILEGYIKEKQQREESSNVRRTKSSKKLYSS
jgi:hypothetical protein